MKDEKILQDILETIEFVRDHAVTKEDLRKTKNEITHYEKLETEIAALNGKCQRLEAFIHQIAKHVGLQLSS